MPIEAFEAFPDVKYMYKRKGDEAFSGNPEWRDGNGEIQQSDDLVWGGRVRGRDSWGGPDHEPAGAVEERSAIRRQRRRDHDAGLLIKVARLPQKAFRKSVTERKPSGLRSLGFFSIVFGIALLSTASIAETGNSGRVLIYYGNETTAAAVASKNYHVLLTSLRAYGGRDGQVIADEIENDAKISPAVAHTEVQALLHSCGRLNADIAVFTNELTLTGHFQFCRAGSQSVETLSFAGVAPAPDDILNLTPLSRPEYLQAALEHVGALFAEKPIDAVLVTHSHGGADMALMPRVSAEVAALDTTTQQHILDFRDSKPAWAALKGTTKVDYWRVLAEVSRKYRMRFALVFRQACQSGLDSWAEFGTIPESVNLIAHTAMGDLPYGKIDYASLLSAAEASPDLAEALGVNLRAQGMHVDAKWPFLLWLGPVYLWSVPPALWFAPIALWICWFIWTRVAHTRRVKIGATAAPQTTA